MSKDSEQMAIIKWALWQKWDRLAQKAVMIACNWGSYRQAHQNLLEI